MASLGKALLSADDMTVILLPYEFTPAMGVLQDVYAKGIMVTVMCMDATYYECIHIYVP
jgi:hypothetical protein